MTTLTVEQFQQVLPVGLRNNINQSLIDQVNNTLEHPEVLEVLKENLLGFTSVMRDGKFRMEQYINAVKYVSFKLMNDTNRNAYIRTFPDKYTQFKADGVSEKDISSYIVAYNKSKLVNLIFEQTLIPTHILNAPMFQQALNCQADLMMNANSEKVRSDAANSILTHLKRPEKQQVEMNIAISEDKTIQALRATTMELVKQQKSMIEGGLISVGAVAKSKLVEGGDVIDI